MQLQLRPSGTARISEFQIYIETVDPGYDWMIDHAGAHRGRITVLRAASSLFAHEEHTRETLPSDDTTMTVYARDPGFNNAYLSFHYTLPFPWGSASR